MPMLKAVLLVCALNVPPGECRPETALDVVVGPEVGNVTACGLHGQAYFAQSALAQGLTGREYLKVICVAADAPAGPVPGRSDAPVAERPIDGQAPAAGPHGPTPRHRGGS